MLKLTYTENDFWLEHLTQPLEAWVATRVMLAIRAGTGLCVEPSSASFILPADLSSLADLENALLEENPEFITLSVCDDESIEVSLEGTWVTSDVESEEGIFVTTMSYGAEFFLYKIWQEANTCASVTQDS